MGSHNATHCVYFLDVRCIADVRQGVGQLLCHVTSVKSLSSIRDAVHRLLVQVKHSATAVLNELYL